MNSEKNTAVQVKNGRNVNMIPKLLRLEMPAASKADFSNVKMITKEELHRKMQAGEGLQILNVLNPSQYSMGMIKGSQKIPLDCLDIRIRELNKAKPVVTYCSNSECEASKSAAQHLTAKGFDVSAYEGGIQEWKAAALPIDISQNDKKRRSGIRRRSLPSW